MHGRPRRRDGRPSVRWLDGSFVWRDGRLVRFGRWSVRSVRGPEGTTDSGVWWVDLVRELRDPDVQHGLGYPLAIAGAIGRERAGDDSR
ncbi:DUF1641 domain-containing protein [Halopenitus salinus]|uniref:DUF1641 domain-containing protein n=1 Tax=Halopenitus salinus TaxID=1198295 RepID=A0ABD5URQ9_9EURY